MHRSPAEPYAADTAASAAISMSASGSTTMWFFAPPSACTRLPCAVPVTYTCARDRRRADEAAPRRCRDARGCRSTATLSPCTTLKHAVGQTRPRASSSASNSDADGSFSLGFSTNVLPHAIARRQHPQRHHRREVERRDAGDDAERLADRVHVDAGGGLLAEPALQQVRGCRTRTRRSRCPRASSPAASESTLPCSAVSDGGDLGAMLVEQVPEPEHHLGAARQRVAPPRGERVRPRPRRRRRPPRRRGRRRPSACCSPVAGFADRRRCGPTCARHPLAADPVC